MIIITLRNLICIIGLICVLPFLCIASLLIVLEDGFPVFFSQKRIGKSKTIFTIFKIRTMQKNTPELGTHDVDTLFQLKTGKVIRAIKLDEFPQLINVIKGELNLVGPRPGLDNQIELIEERIAQDIYAVKPGITGISQILGYNMSNPKKLAKVDKIFVKHQSATLKILILLGTFFKYPRNYLSSMYRIQIQEKEPL